MRGFKSLLAGIVAGTAIGVLFAPKKGQEYRKKFKKEFDDGGVGIDTLKEIGIGLGKEIHESYDKLSENESFKKAEAVLKEKASEAVKLSKQLYDENIPACTKKKIKKGYAKAKKEAKQAAKELQKTAKKVKKTATTTKRKVAKKVAKKVTPKKK